METVETVPRFGGALCLEFANTVDPRNSESAVDLLREREDVLRFGARSGLAVRVPKRRRTAPELAAATEAEELARARALREAVYSAFAAIADGREADPEALALVQSAYADAMARSDLRPGDGYDWESKASGVDAVLDAVARDAVELLRSPARARVKRCSDGDDGCGWLFVDVTKSGTRRWCSMAICGSRAKASRQRARSK